MRFWVGVSSAFGAGVIIGIGAGILLTEKKLKEEYLESTKSYRRALEAARIDAETPVNLESDLVHLQPHNPDAVQLQEWSGESINDKPSLMAITDKGPHPANPYWDAKAVAGEVNILAYAELNEDDWEDANGNRKEQLTMIYSDNEAIFFKDGEEIELSDAMDMVGGTIVDDMREAVREGRPVVWVRNNQTDTDFEVIFEQP